LQTLVAPMPFSVRGYYADRPLMVTRETARRAFAKAVEWHVVERFTDVTISDGQKSYSIDEFSLAMALEEIANTVEAAAELGLKAKAE
jgi:hypothetical protein